MDTKQELINMVNDIAETVSYGVEVTQEMIDDGYVEAEEYEPGDGMSAIDYLADALDTHYIIGAQGSYIGSEVLVSSGGPDIWINTARNRVEGYWGSDEAFTEFSDGMNLDEALEGLYLSI